MTGFGLILLLVAIPSLAYCTGERDINTACVELALKDSDDVNKIMDSCYMTASDETRNSPNMLEEIKLDLQKLKLDYQSALKKARRDSYESHDEADGSVENESANDPLNDIHVDAKNAGDLISVDKIDVDDEDEANTDDVDLRDLKDDEEKTNSGVFLQETQKNPAAWGSRRRFSTRRWLTRRRFSTRRRWVTRRRFSTRRRLVTRRRNSNLRRRSSIRRRSFWRRRSTRGRRSSQRKGWFRRRTSSIRRRTWRRRFSGRPGKPKVNGCSIPLGLYFPYKRTFTPSCNRHDVCYYKERYNRRSCDNTFYTNMLNKCKSYGSVKKVFCRRFAGIYYRAVRAFGKSHYG